MKILEFLNHNIKMWKDGSIYKIEPILFTNFSKLHKQSMGEIFLEKSELAELIVNLNELLHGTKKMETLE